jgi:hypothetical protein
MKVVDLGSKNKEVVEWKYFVQRLITNNVILKEEEYQLVWAKNLVSGYYTTRLGYEAMLTKVQDQIKQWWWKNVWKIRASLKTMVFL